MESKSEIEIESGIKQKRERLCACVCDRERGNVREQGVEPREKVIKGRRENLRCKIRQKGRKSHRTVRKLCHDLLNRRLKRFTSLKKRHFLCRRRRRCCRRHCRRRRLGVGLFYFFHNFFWQAAASTRQLKNAIGFWKIENWSLVLESQRFFFAKYFVFLIIRNWTTLSEL